MPLAAEVPPKPPQESSPIPEEEFKPLFEYNDQLENHMQDLLMDPRNSEIPHGQNSATITVLLLRTLHQAEEQYRHREERSLLGYVGDSVLPHRKKRAAEREREGTKYLIVNAVLQKALSGRLPDPRTGGIPDSKIAESNAQTLQRIFGETVDGTELTESQLKTVRLLSLGFLGDRSKPAELLTPYIRENMSPGEILNTHTLAHRTIERVKKLRKHTGKNEAGGELINRMRSLCIALQSSAPKELDSKYEHLYK